MAQLKTIMLIDDDVVLCDLYRVKFEHAGFQVTVYHNAIEALEALKGGSYPSLIILDIIMPGMDGLAFLQEMKRSGLHAPPIIVLSSQSTDRDTDEVFALGGNNYVDKASATPENILERIIDIWRTQEKITGS